MAAGTERFLIEFLRRNDEVLLGLTAAQLESLALLVAGIALTVYLQRRGGLMLPASDRRAPRSAIA
jgi:phosphatidylglycerol:prolipoprotein diacylglycerol transferase